MGRGCSREQFLVETAAIAILFGRDHISIFLSPFLRFGKESHAARLNMGATAYAA